MPGRGLKPEDLRKFRPYEEIFAPVDEDDIERFKSTRRTCQNCKFSWIDTNARPKCPQCWMSMKDGFTFLDTKFGQRMKRQIAAMKMKQRAEEKARWAQIHTAVENGQLSSGKDWQKFRAALLNAELGGGLSFEQRLAIAGNARRKVMNQTTHERLSTLRSAEKKGRSKSAEFWRPSRENVRELMKSAVARKCSNCYHEWMDPFGKQICIKCGEAMEDGVPEVRYPFELHWSQTSAPLPPIGIPDMPPVKIPGRDIHTR
jgi:hypothetical protein